MKRFRNILVMAGGKDGGDAALERAATVARQNSAKINLVDFIAPLPESFDFADSEIAQLHRGLSDAKLSNLKRMTSPLRQEGLSVVYELIEGPPEKVLQRVVGHQHDLLVKSAEEPPGLARRIFGTTGLRILRKCPCPCWIIKASGPKHIQRILVAIEPMPLDQPRDPLNIKIIQLATSIAAADEAELHVVYVWPDWAEVSASSSESDSSDDLDSTRREVKSLQESMLNELLDPFRSEGHTFETHLLNGDPSEVIAQQCRQLHADLLVMGTIQRPSLLGFVMGSTAERVLDQVRCSALTVKPDNFESFTAAATS